MRTIRNLTTKPLRVPLHEGKILHLGPRKEGQIATRDLDRPGVQRLIDDASIEVLGETSMSSRSAHRRMSAPSASFDSTSPGPSTCRSMTCPVSLGIDRHYTDRQRSV